MVARGQFRDHPAIGLVQIHLGVQHMRQQAAAVIEDGDGRFVAGGFEGEDAHGEGQILPFGSGVIRLLDPAAAGSWGGRFDFPFLIKDLRFQMPSVRVRENEYFDAALRRFKRACEKAGVLTDLRRREFYEKPTQERKRKKAAAVKRAVKRTSPRIVRPR